MIEKFTTSLSEMPAVDIVENVALFLILILGLVMFFRSSSAFNRYFIPTVCIMATILRVVHWAHHGDEPAFMTPLVTVVAGWMS